MNWSKRLGVVSFVFGIAALVLPLASTSLARYDVIDKLTGLSGMVYGFYVAVIGVCVGIAAICVALHARARKRFALIGLLLCLGYAAFIYSRNSIVQDVPLLHDISTDLQNPPAFTRVTLRADNLKGVDTIENWRNQHAKGYPNLKPINLAGAVPEVIANAERIARAQGWDVLLADPAIGRLEATATVSWIRYRDDVVVRVTPHADGRSVWIDMRSVSRVGTSDLGVNARRIESFMSALAKSR